VNVSEVSPSARKSIANTLVAIQFASLTLLAIGTLLQLPNSKFEYLWFEVALIALGIAVILFAARVLKPSLRVSPIPKPNSPFIATGIYKYVRHPMYLGVILIGFGLAGLADSPYFWIVELILIINLNIKARFEETLLLEIHPDAWHYQRHTSRILPCLGSSCRNTCL